jgi:hypothetical protein
MPALRRRPALEIAVVAATMVCAACRTPPRKACITLPPPAAPAGAAQVQVTFLGVGAVLVEWQGKAVLTAPLYSNPTIPEIALSDTRTDRQRLDALMRRDVSQVRAILSGHSHYDHLMDVPYVALHKATAADIVGNHAMVKLLHPIEKNLQGRTPPNRLVSLEESTGDYDVPGTPIRVRAIVSEHSPQIGPQLVTRTARLAQWLVPIPEVTLWRGEDEYALETLPTRVSAWPAGTTLAFVIELLEPSTGAVAFRIYYQDSPTRKPYGYPPPATAAYGYDLAILCMGGATEFPTFPGDIVQHLKPGAVMGIHWEDFFNPRQLPLPGETHRREELLYAPGVDEAKFIKAVGKAVAGTPAIVPCPDQTLRFASVGGRWRMAEEAPASR